MAKARGPGELPEEIDDMELDPEELTTLESVGTGLTAEVFRGSWKGQEVAIKRINLRRSRLAPRDQKAFVREVLIMRKVNHRNLVKMLGLSSRTEPLQIVTEFCAGGNAFELLQNGIHVDLTWLQRTKMSIDVGHAMEYLHNFSPQIIHRDLKSLNLLVMERVDVQTDIPLVKVSDFGLGRMKDGEGVEWGKMTMDVGTCHWMAPEVLTSNRYNEKIDVYSYAMILFEVICRRIPFEDYEPAEAVRLVVQGYRPSLEMVPETCPEKLRVLMTVCWDHDSVQRPDFAKVNRWLKIISTELPDRTIQL